MPTKQESLTEINKRIAALQSSAAGLKLEICFEDATRTANENAKRDRELRLRNHAILEFYRADIPFSKIAEHFGLHKTTCREIVKKLERAERNNTPRRVASIASSVDDLDLSVRAANCLNNASIYTVLELIKKTDKELLKYRNFGKKGLYEIKGKLAQIGLELGMTSIPTDIRTEDK